MFDIFGYPDYLFNVCMVNEYYGDAALCLTILQLSKGGKDLSLKAAKLLLNDLPVQTQLQRDVQRFIDTLSL